MSLNSFIRIEGLPLPTALIKKVPSLLLVTALLLFSDVSSALSQQQNHKAPASPGDNANRQEKYEKVRWALVDLERTEAEAIRKGQASPGYQQKVAALIELAELAPMSESRTRWLCRTADELSHVTANGHSEFLSQYRVLQKWRRL